MALVAERRLSKAAPGRERNAIARDSYCYLHFPMVAGIVLLALGFKKTLGHVGERARARAGDGAARRHRALPRSRTSRSGCATSTASASQRLLCAIVLRGADPGGARAARAGDARASSPRVLVALIVYESIRFAELRDRLRHQVAEG